MKGQFTLSFRSRHSILRMLKSQKKNLWVLTFSGADLQPLLNDFQISVLQRHLKVARQHPVCILFRNEGTTLVYISSLISKSQNIFYWVYVDTDSDFV